MSCQGAAMLLPGIITVKGVTLTPADLPGIWGSIPVFSSVQFSLSVLSDSLWFHGLQEFLQSSLQECKASLSITNSQSLLKLMSIKSVIPSKHLILCQPLLFLSSVFPSIRVFSKDSCLHIRCPKYWSLNFSISPSNEYSGLISFRMDWLDLLAVHPPSYPLLYHSINLISLLITTATSLPTTLPTTPHSVLSSVVDQEYRSPSSPHTLIYPNCNSQGQVTPPFPDSLGPSFLLC